MNRKNQKLVCYMIGVVLGLFTAGLLMLFAGCAADEVSAAEAKTNKRFTTELARINVHGSYWILTDNETGVQYLAFETGHGVGLTVLQPGDTDAEGENHG